MTKNRLYLGLSIGLLLITIVIFGIYIHDHSYLLNRLKTISPWIILWLTLLYGLWFVALSVIIKYSLKICNVKLSAQENILLNAYSTIVNFFVPGQGGPAVRGAYLYKKYKLKIRLYILVTLIYYLIYGVINSLITFSTTKYWWILAPLYLGVFLISFYGGRKYISKFKIKHEELNFKPINLIYLTLATMFQILIVMTINIIELHSVNHSVSLKQIMIYTGVENLTIFVALTPGAIGIRESFLIFSRKLHHISVASIISASIIDRSIFIIVLAILLIYVVVTHTKSKLFTK